LFVYITSVQWGIATDDMQIYKLPQGEKFIVGCVGVKILLPYDVAQDFVPKSSRNPSGFSEVITVQSPFSTS
jgi:hypothetical protein